MKIVPSISHTPDQLQARLDHYNKWLMDPNRPFVSTYPGFPDDKKLENARKKLAEDFSKRNIKVVDIVPKKRAKSPKKASGFVSLKSLASELYAKHSGNKELVINDLINTGGMTKAGATTYFYNAKKAST